MPVQPGTRLGPYEILSMIGAGGMGEVYKARDTRLDRTVAIKVLPAHLSNRPELRERFEREALAVAGLNHPHICVLHDIGREASIDYLVMEYLDGETLAERLKRGPLPLDETLRHAMEIAGALDRAHSAGITHRDLKPQNIMLTRTGAKLLDFGLAKLKHEAQPSSTFSALPTNAALTAQGAILGTLQYMSPEQLEGKDADARSDIFAFGAVLHEMATGHKAFEGTSQASLIGAILKDTPRPVSTFAPATPSALDHVVSTCMAKDPENRWQTARDVVRGLEYGIAERSEKRSEPVPAASGRSTRTAWIVAFVAVAGLLAALVPVIRHLREPARNIEVTRFTIETPLMPNQYDLAISPDGRQQSAARKKSSMNPPKTRCRNSFQVMARRLCFARA